MARSHTLSILGATIRGQTILSRGWLSDLKNRKQTWVLPLALFGVLAGGGSLVWLLVQNYTALVFVGREVGAPELPVFSSLLASWVLNFVFGIPVAMSVLYFSPDTRLLLTLPVRTRAIVSAKIGLLVFYALPIHLLLTVPVVVVAWGAGVYAPGATILGSLVLFVLGPLPPVTLAVLLVGLLMRVVNLSRIRTALELVGMLLALVGIIALQLFLSGTMQAAAGAGVEGAIPRDLAAGLVAWMDAIPPARWMSGIFVAGGAGDLLGSLGVSAGLLAVVALVVDRLFLADIGRRGETRGPGRGRREGDLRAGSAVAALTGREWTVLSAHSTFLFEAFGQIIVFPLILVVFQFSMPAEAMDGLLTALPETDVLGLIALGVLLLFGTLSTVSATSISREGKTFALSLVLPVPGRLQIRAKLRFHFLIVGPAYILNTAILFLALPIPLSAMVYILPAGFAMLITSFCIGMNMDLRRPMTSWSHPQQAMKQNMNALAALGLNFLAFLVLGGAAVVVYMAVGSGLAAGLVVVAVAGLAGLILWPALLRLADRQYATGLEV